MDTGILPSGELISQADVDAVAATPQGWRAFALLQVGQPDRAEAELRGLWSKASTNPVFARSLLMVASAAGLTDCAAQMAAALQSQRWPTATTNCASRCPGCVRPAGSVSIRRWSTR